MRSRYSSQIFFIASACFYPSDKTCNFLHSLATGYDHSVATAITLSCNLVTRSPYRDKRHKINTFGKGS